jgi:hypoxanthine phosphoribosyltransferase
MEAFMHKDVKKVLVSSDEIEQRCIELGAQITKDYLELGEVPILVSLLKGSVPFLAKLMPYIDLDVEIDFMDVSSYEGTESIGDVRIIKDLDRSIKGESILLVEDIVDTGRTLNSVKELLENKGCERLRIVSLLDKPTRRVVKIDADYVGFTIPNEFVIGFGLDFNEKYRSLPYVGVLKDECYL